MNTKGVLVLRIVFFLFLFTSTCMAAEIHEADNNQKFPEIVGKTFLLKAEFSMHDISSQDSSGNFQPRYTITNLPGVAGREIRSKRTLPINTSLKVNAIYTCKLCALLRNEQLIVTLVGDERYANTRIEMRGIDGKDLILYENKKAFLNPEFFELKE